MGRPNITEEFACTVARRAHAGESVESLAAEYELSDWVIRLIVEAHPPGSGPPPKRREKRAHAATNEPPLDPADVARIRRMLGAGRSLADVAEELGLRPKMIRAALKNPRFGARLSLRKDERYVTRPTRCPICKAPLRIVPCRACRIRDLIRRGQKVWRDEEPAS